MEKTIEIPEGYEARIEGNKVILEMNDESIRNFLYEFIKVCGWSEKQYPPREKCLAYLERQKEQQPVQDKEEREYVRTIKSIIVDFLRGKDEIDREYYQKIYDWLDGRHIEQKLTNDRYMEGYMDGYAKGSKNAEDSYNRGVSYHFDNSNIQRLDPNVVIESKTGEMHPDVVRGTLTGGESIEDKDAIEVTPKQDYSGLTDLERAIHRGFLCAGVENVPVGIIKDTAQDCLAHIKPAKWSERDEYVYNEILKRVADKKIYEHDLDYIYKWLKSLRPSWKPSDK